jgi:hypothetical protein
MGAGRARRRFLKTRLKMILNKAHKVCV